MSAKVKNEKKTRSASGSGKKSEGAKASKFTPEEMKIFQRLWASHAGRRALLGLALIVIVLIFVLVSGKSAHLFLLLLGVMLLLLILAFWIFLIYQRRKEADQYPL